MTLLRYFVAGVKLLIAELVMGVLLFVLVFLLALGFATAAGADAPGVSISGVQGAITANTGSYMGVFLILLVIILFGAIYVSGMVLRRLWGWE